MNVARLTAASASARLPRIVPMTIAASYVIADLFEYTAHSINLAAALVKSADLDVCADHIRLAY